MSGVGVRSCAESPTGSRNSSDRQCNEPDSFAVHRAVSVRPCGKKPGPVARAGAGMVAPVVLPVLFVFVTVILLALCQQTLAPRLPFPVTVRAETHRRTSRQRFTQDFTTLKAIRVGSSGGPGSSREARGRGRDPLRDHRATVGYDVRTPWYIRVRSLLILVVLVIGLGMAIAGVTLLIIASGRFLLEILAG